MSVQLTEYQRKALVALEWFLSAARHVRDGVAPHIAFSDGRCQFAMVTHPSLAGISVSAQLKRALSPGG